MKYGIYELECGKIAATPLAVLGGNFRHILTLPLPEECSKCPHLKTEIRGMRGYSCLSKRSMGQVNISTEEVKALAVRKYQGEESTKELYRNAQADREGI